MNLNLKTPIKCPECGSILIERDFPKFRSNVRIAAETGIRFRKVKECQTPNCPGNVYIYELNEKEV